MIAFVHGRHAVCLGTPSPGQQVCDDLVDDNGTPIQTDVRSYGGYDYMAKNLASHGYAVMSLEANTSNFDNGLHRTAERRVRSLITQANLELLWRWNNGAGPYVPGEPDHTVGTKLVGKLNFAEGIGLMGHSRGGDAVTDFIAYTRNLTPRSGLPALHARRRAWRSRRSTTRRTKCRTAPTTHVLLPACDGDVSTLQGARFFENAKYPTITTPTAVRRLREGPVVRPGHQPQLLQHGLDAGRRLHHHRPRLLAPAAGHHGAPDARRSAARRQRADELVLPPLRRQGDGIRPDHDRRGDAARVRCAAQAAARASTRRSRPPTSRPPHSASTCCRPNPIPDPQPDPATGATPTPADATLTTTTASGGPISTSGLTSFFVCNPNDLAWRPGPTRTRRPTRCARRAPPTAPRATSSRSRGTRPAATCAPFLGRPRAAPVDVSKYGVLDLRAALNRD